MALCMERPRSCSLQSTIEASPLVSMIVPCHNGEAYLAECIDSVLLQTHRPLELSFWNDASTDASLTVLQRFQPELESAGIVLKMGHTSTEKPGGAGYAKSQAIRQCTGEYLCFLDCDDTCSPHRVEKQLDVALKEPTALIGCNFIRDPVTATPQYANWLNCLTDEQLHLEKFCECTIIMPTWFCHRDVIDSAGGLSSQGHAGTVEDLLFFHEHLKLGRPLRKVPEALVTYRQHQGQISVSSVPFAAIWTVRLEFLAAHLLETVSQFAICSADRDAKKLYRHLPAKLRRKCMCLVDIDKKKLCSPTAGMVDKELNRHVPVVPYGPDLPTPLIVCWKRGFDLDSQAALAELEMVEGTDFWHFFRSFT